MISLRDMRGSLKGLHLENCKEMTENKIPGRIMVKTEKTG